MLAVMYVAIFIHIILHELGHLIGGLMSGYEFCSFRIMSFMWKKENGKIRLRRMNLAGTGGQCLMSPPDMINGKIPVFIYNLICNNTIDERVLAIVQMKKLMTDYIIDDIIPKEGYNQLKQYIEDLI